MHDNLNAIKHLIDGAAVVAAWAAFFDAAPKIAAVLSIVWFVIQTCILIRNERRSKK